MLRVRCRGRRLTARILALISLGHGCILGVPTGIWGLVVLDRVDLIRPFRRPEDLGEVFS